MLEQTESTNIRSDGRSMRGLSQAQMGSSPEISSGAPARDSKHVSSSRARNAGVSAQIIASNPWSCSRLTLFVTTFSALLLAIICRSFLTLQRDPKGCAMSYMRPIFYHFSDFDTEYTRFASKYSLFLYREGGIDEDILVKGVPVLFIPGNAGSYKQVRPIAAEAANYYHEDLQHSAEALAEWKRPLDVFTVDFNEELTAFHGQTLLDQAEYLNDAIAFILSLYHDPQRTRRETNLPEPQSIIIIGHSMGGMVARTMLHTLNYRNHSINTVFTLSTPHARSPVSFDGEMVATYQRTNAFWRNSFLVEPQNMNPLAEMTLVSIAGGGLDTMIPPEFSSVASLIPDTHGFTVFTSSIPSVWTGADHLAIMWCDQFRKALVKAIFDTVDARSPSQTLPRHTRINALRRRLLTGMEHAVEKPNIDDLPNVHLDVDPTTTQILQLGQRLELHPSGQSELKRIRLMPVPAASPAEDDEFMLLTDHHIDASRENGTLKVFLCRVSSDDTQSQSDSERLLLHPEWFTCRNAAVRSSLLPRSNAASHNAFDFASPFSYLYLDRTDLTGSEFVAIVESASEPHDGWLLAEFTTRAQSSLEISLGHRELLLEGLELQLPPSRPLMSLMKIPEVHSTMFAYRLSIDRQIRGRCIEKFTPLLRQAIQEPFESKYLVNTQGGNINLHGISPYLPPPLKGGKASEGLTLQLWTDTGCKSVVKLQLKVDVIGSAGRLVMRYRTAFAAFPILVVAIVLRKQFRVYDKTEVFISFSHSMDQCIRTSLPVIFAALTSLAIALSSATQGPWMHSVLPVSSRSAKDNIDYNVNDLLLGTSDSFFWFLVPLFGIISVGICIAANVLILSLTHSITFILSTIASWIRKTTTTKSIGQESQQPSYARRILTVGALLLLLATIVPYQLVYVVLCIMQVSSSVQALWRVKTSESSLEVYRYNYLHSMLVLMFGILPIGLPVLIVWIRNLQVHWLMPLSTFHNILSILPLILLVDTMSAGGMIPCTPTKLRFGTNILLFAFALYAAVYGVTYAYRLHHMVNGLCAWLLFLHSRNEVSRAEKVSISERITVAEKTPLVEGDTQ